ncbi:MAG: antitoxin [Desulfovibrionales bacterium]|nr:MAG: antitoxin [Desulfovibrionales bacterium]
MHTTNLRKVGGSVMLAVPPVILDLLKLNVGSKVGLSVDSGSLLVKPAQKPRYTLDELLALCDPSQEVNEEDRAWLDSGPTGKELL